MPMSAGTSTTGPMTAANAAPELMPKTATATAMARSNLFETAVSEVARGDAEGHRQEDSERQRSKNESRPDVFGWQVSIAVLIGSPSPLRPARRVPGP